MPFWKPKPKGMKAKADRREDERVYRKNRLVALHRENFVCQLCEARAREAHHVGERKRSKTRGMPPEYRHDPDWLMAVCGVGNVSGCHSLLETGEVKVYGNARKFTCERWEDGKNGAPGRHVPWVPPAKRKAA